MFSLVAGSPQLINPGNSNLFPWLASLAQKFTQYRFQGLVFHFKSTSGSLATTQALGEVIMCVNYDPTENTFASKEQMLNEVMSVSKAPCFDATLGVETAPAQTQNGGLLYVSKNGADVGDPRFYSLGQLYVACQGMPANGYNLGELWVSYQVELFKPQIRNDEYTVDNSYYICDNHLSATNYTGILPTGAFEVNDLACNMYNYADRTHFMLPVRLASYDYMITAEISGVSDASPVTEFSLMLYTFAGSNAIASGTNLPFLSHTNPGFACSSSDVVRVASGGNEHVTCRYIIHVPPNSNIGCWLYGTTAGGLKFPKNFKVSYWVLRLATTDNINT